MSQLSLKIAAARPEPPPHFAGRWVARADGADTLESWLSGPLGRSVRRRLPKGAHLFQEGAETDSLYFFLRGWAMKYKSLLDGRRQILDFVLPGEPLGFVMPQPAPYAVEMLNEAEIVAVSRRAFDALFESDPAFARAICRQLESSGARAHERMTSIGYRSARVRVCRLLVELIERAHHGRAVPAQATIAMPLSQRHIADATALRVETVCRALVQLQEEQMASVRRGQLRVPDLPALAAAC
jgi:CRP/FNR family transcriptional regulator